MYFATKDLCIAWSTAAHKASTIPEDTNAKNGKLRQDNTLRITHPPINGSGMPAPYKLV